VTVNRSLLASLGMTAVSCALAYGALAVRSGRQESVGEGGTVLAALACLSMVIIAALTLRSVIEGTRRGEFGAFALLAAQAAALVWLIFRLIE
jgi:hypothetical protein